MPFRARRRTNGASPPGPASISGSGARYARATSSTIPLQRGIIKLMIDDLNEMQMRLCGNGAAGADKFKNAYHVDIRGTLKDREWADELHPTDAGFVKVGARFRTVLAKLGL